MPWKKSFDVDVALEQTMDAFWLNGYKATSIRDLLAATRLQRGSFYNAFGGKSSAFLRGFERYLAGRERIYAALEKKSPRAAITGFFEQVLRETRADDGRKGCLIVNSVIEINHHEPDVQLRIREGLRDVEAFFERAIRRGVQSGEIPDTVDASEAAYALLGLVIAIRVLARGGAPMSAIRMLARSAEVYVS